MLDRNAIFAALYARLKAKVSAKFFTDSHVTVNDLASNGKQPALEFNQSAFRNANRPGMPTLSTLEAEVYLFVRQSGSADAATQLVDLAEEIEAALGEQPDESRNGAQTTLGGLVEWAWVTSVQIEHGDLSGQAVAQVKIEMLAAGND